MDAACSNVARVAGKQSDNHNNTNTIGTKAAGFAFDWLGVFDVLSYRDADHPSATGYRHQP